MAAHYNSQALDFDRFSCLIISGGFQELGSARRITCRIAEGTSPYSTVVCSNHFARRKQYWQCLAMRNPSSIRKISATKLYLATTMYSRALSHTIPLPVLFGSMFLNRFISAQAPEVGSRFVIVGATWQFLKFQGIRIRARMLASLHAVPFEKTGSLLVTCS